MSGPIDLARREAGFDALYAGDPDPWGFETSDYEHRKYDATLAALGARRFERALEVGLVDQLGDLRDAFAEAVKRAGHSEARLVRYDREAQPVPVPEASWRGLLPTTLQGTGAWYLWEAGAR